MALTLATNHIAPRSNETCKSSTVQLVSFIALCEVSRMAEGSSTELSDITAVHTSESNSSPVEPEFVASFFVSNNSLFLHFGPDGPVLVLTKDSISELHMKVDERIDTVLLVTLLGTFIIKKESVGDLQELWIWFLDLRCKYANWQ